MSFELTKQQEMIQKAAADLSKGILDPIAFDIDRTAEYPENAVKELAKTGLFGITIPAENGGTGADMLSYVLCVEEMGKICASVAAIVVAHTSKAAMPIAKYGKDSVKSTYLPAMARGECIGGYALGEPGAALASGSDKLVAKKDGDNYILNGKKYYVENGGVAGVYVVVAQTNEEAGQRGISCFVVDAKSDGLKVARKVGKQGLRNLPTALMEFNNVKVPAANLLGTEEQGGAIVSDIMANADIAFGGVASGIGQIALEESIAHAKRRVQFGSPIAKLQAIQIMLSEMSTINYLIQLSAYSCAKTLDNKGDYIVESAKLKQYAMKAGLDCTSNAVQIHGGTGYSREAKIERYFRDMNGVYIYENSSDYPFKAIYPAIAK